MFSGFICPEHGEKPDRNNEIDYCIAKCKNPCVAPHVLASMIIDDLEDTVHRGNTISVTMLTGGCKRQTLLERELPFWLYPNKKLPTFRGTLIHGVVEKSKKYMTDHYQWMIEQHMELPFTTDSGEWVLSGTLDAFDPTREILYDIKTLQEYAVKLTATGKQNGTWSDHVSDAYVKQLNIYRYMLEQTYGVKVAKLVLQIIGFGQFVTTGHEDQIIALQKGFKFSREPYDIPDIPIVPDKTVEHWIKSEGDEWNRIFNEGLKPSVVHPSYKWLCKICAFKETEHCPDPDKEREENDSK